MARRHLRARLLGQLLTVQTLLYFNHWRWGVGLFLISVGVRGIKMVVNDQVVKLHFCYLNGMFLKHLFIKWLLMICEVRSLLMQVVML